MGLHKGGEKTNATYINIIQGDFRQSVKEGTPGAEERTWEKDGKTGTKYEMVYRDGASGKITSLNYEDGNFGTNLIVTLQDSDGKIVVNIPENSRYYDDFAKKLMAIDYNTEVHLKPYDFETGEVNKKGNPVRKTGITVTQNGEKVTSYYWDGKKIINNYPKVNEKEKEEMGKDYWKIYFTKVNVFLKKEIKGIEIPEYEDGLGGDLPTPPPAGSTREPEITLEDDLDF